MKIKSKKDLVQFLQGIEKLQAKKIDKLFPKAVNYLAGEIANHAYRQGLRYGEDWQNFLNQYS